MSTKYYCTCENWEKGMNEIIAQQVFCEVHSFAPEYNSPAFKYCPWCGKLLKAEEIKDE